MPYTAPDGGHADFNLSGGYSAPVGDEAALALGDSVSYTAIEAGCVIVCGYGEPVESGCALVLAVAADAIESGCDIVMALASEEIEAGCETIRAEMIDSACLFIRTETTPIEAGCMIVMRDAIPIERSCILVRQEYALIESGCEIVVALAGTLVESFCTIDCGHLERTRQPGLKSSHWFR